MVGESCSLGMYFSLEATGRQNMQKSLGMDFSWVPDVTAMNSSDAAFLLALIFVLYWRTSPFFRKLLVFRFFQFATVLSTNVKVSG